MSSGAGGDQKALWRVSLGPGQVQTVHPHPLSCLRPLDALGCEMYKTPFCKDNEKYPLSADSDLCLQVDQRQLWTVMCQPVNTDPLKTEKLGKY